MRLDNDLPGDADFKALPAQVEILIPSPGGTTWAIANTVSPEEQAAIHHNRLRYSELQKARMSRPNQYAETRYR